MTSQQLLLGVDSGGSKTRAVLADADGHILGEGLAGSSNYQYVGEARAVAEIEAGIDAAFVQAGQPRRGVDYACFGIGGADTPEEVIPASTGAHHIALLRDDGDDQCIGGIAIRRRP